MEVLLCISEHSTLLFPVSTWKEYFKHFHIIESLKFFTFNNKFIIDTNSLVTSVTKSGRNILDFPIETLRTDINFLNAVKETLPFINGYFIFESKEFGDILYRIVSCSETFKIKINKDSQEIVLE